MTAREIIEPYLTQIEPAAHRGAMVGVAELRTAMKLDMRSFASLMLRCEQAGVLTLHCSDFPSGMTDEQRAESFGTGRTWHGTGTKRLCVGVALRRN